MIKTGKELAAACVDAAKNYKTLYVMGAFGWPMNDHNKQRAMGSYSYNSATDRTAKIKAATNDTFGFDCVCLIKALLWGWLGDAKQNYGGAKYCSNNVPDVNEDGMIRACTEVNADFGKIAVGEVLWTSGHIGVYIGGGLAVECTPIWKDGVQITAVHNIGKKSGYNGRMWAKHGKLPWVTYEKEETTGKDYTISFRYLCKGDKGDDVVALQRLLIANGYSCGWYGADGDFGAETDTAVRLYQRDTDLEADGVVGKDTLSKLLGVN
jgi:hypothetical protein